MKKNIIVIAVCSMLVVSFGLMAKPASVAAGKWSCGGWKKDPAGKCEKIRVCKRSTCKAGKKLTGCINETQTERLNCKPATGTASTRFSRTPRMQAGKVKRTAKPKNSARNKARRAARMRSRSRLISAPKNARCRKVKGGKSLCIIKRRRYSCNSRRQKCSLVR